MAKKFGKKAHVMSIAMPSEHNYKPHMDKYQVEDAARTLTRHQEIKSDKKLHRAAKMHLKRKHVLEAKAIKEK